MGSAVGRNLSATCAVCPGCPPASYRKASCCLESFCKKAALKKAVMSFQNTCSVFFRVFWLCHSADALRPRLSLNWCTFRKRGPKLQFFQSFAGFIHILPWQIKSTLINVIILLVLPGNAPFCKGFRVFCYFYSLDKPVQNIANFSMLLLPLSSRNGSKTRMSYY